MKFPSEEQLETLIDQLERGNFWPFAAKLHVACGRGPEAYAHYDLTDEERAEVDATTPEEGIEVAKQIMGAIQASQEY